MAQSEERRKEYQKRYREMLHEEYRDDYTLTKEEKIQMGLIQKPSVLKGNIHIVIPVHYDSRSVWWESRFVSWIMNCYLGEDNAHDL